MIKTLLLILTDLLCLTAHADTFKGYQCKSDCSGHKAGYEWARKKGVTDPDQCTGKSQSFEEGCRAWAEGK